MNNSKKKVFKNIIWLLYSKVFTLILNLLVTVRIVNFFGSEEYGIYYYAVSVVAILEIIVSLVETRVVKKKYEKYDASIIVFNSTIAKIFLSIIALSIGIVYMCIYKGNLLFNIMFVILLFNAILTNLRFGMETHFEYNLNSKSIVIRQNIMLVITAILQIIAVALNFSIISLCIISTLSAIVGFIVTFIQYRHIYRLPFRTKMDSQLIKKIILESIPLSIAAGAATIYTKCDSIMIGHFLGNSEVGVYAVCLKLFSIAQIGVVPVRTSLFPKQMELYKNDKEKYRDLYVGISSIMTWTCIFGIILAYTILPPIFKMAFSKEYTDALQLFNINIFGLLFIYNAVLRTGHYTITNNGKILMVTQIICAIINVVLNVIFIQIWGSRGAAFSTVITQAISLMISNIFFPNGKELFLWQIKAFNPLNCRLIIKRKEGKKIAR